MLSAVGVASLTAVSPLLVPSAALLAPCGTVVETVVETFPASDLLLAIECGLLVAVVDVVGEGLGLVCRTTGTSAQSESDATLLSARRGHQDLGKVDPDRLNPLGEDDAMQKSTSIRQSRRK